MIPIFIFSAPRSGSTFLQRLMESSEMVKGHGEPWILLPLIYMNKKDGIYSEYAHKIANIGISDVSGGLGSEVTKEAIRSYCSTVYDSHLENKELYFVDKTPRYSIICREIIETFGDSARYIFLWRDPLDVMLSLNRTFGGDRFCLHAFDIDLRRGLKNLAKVYEDYKDVSISIYYDQLIERPDKVSDDLNSRLNIDTNKNKLSAKSGLLGDPTPNEKTNRENPISFVTKLYIRKRLKEYSNFPRLNAFESQKKLDKITVSYSIAKNLYDLALIFLGKLMIFVDPYILKIKLSKIRSKEDVYKNS